MSDSRGPLQPCRCIVHKQRSDNGSTIAGKRNSKKLTPLLRELDVRMIDAICPLCSGSINLRRPHRQLKYPFYTDESSSPFAGPQNVIIVNQIPVGIKGKKIDREEFFSLFLEYGKIKDAYLCNDVWYRIKSEKVARITFEKEEDARKVWEASKEKLIKYEDHVLMITLISDDDCPIEHLSDDCLRLIFKYITNAQDKFDVQSVCKRLRSISRESYSSVTTVSSPLNSRTWRTLISRAAGSLRDVEIQIPREDNSSEEASLEDSMENSYEENPRHDAIKSLSLISENLVNLEKFNITVNCKDSSVNSQLNAIIANNKSLKCLRLWSVDLADDNFIDSLPAGMGEIQIYLAKFTKLNYHHNLMHSTPVNISRFGNLQVLALFNFEISEDQLEGIESLRNLRVLNCKMSDVHPSNIEKIVHFTKLEFLAIPDCQISDITFSEILKNNRGLKHLNINDILGITDSSFQHVPQLPNLQVLLMENLSQVTDKYFSSMPKLKVLNCSGCPLITDTGIQRLFTPDSMLEELSISDCSTTVATIETACRGAQVLTLYVNGEIFKKWENSALKESLSQSPDQQKISVIDEIHRSVSDDEVKNNWLEIFDQLD